MLKKERKKERKKEKLRTKPRFEAMGKNLSFFFFLMVKGRGRDQNQIPKPVIHIRNGPGHSVEADSAGGWG